jgi:hypothetical protein
MCKLADYSIWDFSQRDLLDTFPTKTDVQGGVCASLAFEFTLGIWKEGLNWTSQAMLDYLTDRMGNIMHRQEMFQCAARDAEGTDSEVADVYTRLGRIQGLKFRFRYKGGAFDPFLTRMRPMDDGNHMVVFSFVGTDKEHTMTFALKLDDYKDIEYLDLFDPNMGLFTCNEDSLRTFMRLLWAKYKEYGMVIQRWELYTIEAADRNRFSKMEQLLQNAQRPLGR